MLKGTDRRENRERVVSVLFTAGIESICKVIFLWMANFPSSLNPFIANSFVVQLSLTAFIFKEMFHHLPDISQR